MSSDPQMARKIAALVEALAVMLDYLNLPSQIELPALGELAARRFAMRQASPEFEEAVSLWFSTLRQRTDEIRQEGWAAAGATKH